MSEWTSLFVLPHPSSQETEEVRRFSVKLVNDLTRDSRDNNRDQDIDPTTLASNSPRNSIISTSRISIITRNSIATVITDPRNSHLTSGDNDNNLWDDTYIGRILNLVDTIGSEPEVETKDLSKTSIPDSAGNSSQSVRKVHEHQKTDSGFAQIPEEYRVINSQAPETPAQEYARIIRHSLDSPPSEGESQSTKQVNKTDPSSTEDTETAKSQPLRRSTSNLSRRSSIHGRKSTDDGRSIRSKVSRISRVSKVEKITEIPEEDIDIENNGKKIFPGKKKRASSDSTNNKPNNGFLRKFFKSKIDQVVSLNKTLFSMREEIIDADDQSVGGVTTNSINSISSNNDINSVIGGGSMTEEEWQKVFKACEEQGVSLLKKKHNRGGVRGVTCGTREFGNDNYYTSIHEGASRVANDGGDTGHSNFYLAMPNGQWMVRTRTASRKIVDTQYVDINCI